MSIRQLPTHIKLHRRPPRLCHLHQLPLRLHRRSPRLCLHATTDQADSGRVYSLLRRQTTMSCIQMITLFFSGLFCAHKGLLICYTSQRIFHESYTMPLLLGYMKQVTKSLLHQLGAIPRRQLLKSALHQSQVRTSGTSRLEQTQPQVCPDGTGQLQQSQFQIYFPTAQRFERSQLRPDDTSRLQQSQYEACSGGTCRLRSHRLA
jgi:hypothetical protein